MALNPGRSDFPAEPEDGRGKIRPGRRRSRAAGFPDFLPEAFSDKKAGRVPDSAEGPDQNLFPLRFE